VSPRWWETALALTVLAVLQLAVAFNPAIIEVDSEEMWNAGQAWQMLDCHFSEAFLLQYRDFCGGCTLDALLGMGSFAVFGRSWLAWKVVPLLFVLLCAAIGSRALHRVAGRPAAWAFLALLLLPPRSWIFLSGVAWGNHYEAGCLAFCGLATLLHAESRGRAVLAGAVLGLATWVGFSGSFGIAAGVLWLLLIGRRALVLPLLAGVTLGLLPWVLQWLSSGLHPFVTVYESSEAAPSLSRIPYKLGTLLRPRQLVALFGLPEAGLGWVLGWLWAASLTTAAACLAFASHKERRTSEMGRAALAILLFGGTWLAMYCLVRFQIDAPPAPEIAYPNSTRYAAPLLPIAFAALALAAAMLWNQGRRALGVLLLAGPLLAGTLARTESLQAPSPAASVLRLEAVDWEFFRPGFGTRLPLGTIAACDSEDLRTRQLHAYALGRETAADLLRSGGPSLAALQPPEHSERLYWWEGIGDAVAQNLDTSALQAAGEADKLMSFRMSEASLKTLSGGVAEQQAALRVVATADYAIGIDWLKVQGGWDQDSIAAIHGELHNLHATLQNAGWWAHGRACGRALASFHQARPLKLPAGLENVPTAFFEGLGTALGERWGPLDSLPRPQGLPLHAGMALQTGFQRGVARRWLDSQELPPPALPLPQP